MSSEESVTQWIAGLKQADQDSARKLWDRYFRKMAAIARQRLTARDRRVADEEDVASSVFRCLCQGAELQQFSELTDRDDLWSLLVKMTHRKVIDQHRRLTTAKRGSGKIHGESVFVTAGQDPGERVGLAQIIGSEPTPEFLVEVADEHARLFALLPDDTFRQIAMSKMEGKSNEEIAAEMQLSCRSIERKLRKIRHYWSEDHAHSPE